MKPQQPIIASASFGEMINLAGDTVKGYHALYIGATGTVVVDLAEGGVNIPFVGVQVGFFPVAVSKIYSAANGTTASSIVGLRW